MTLKYFRWS